MLLNTENVFLNILNGMPLNFKSVYLSFDIFDLKQFIDKNNVHNYDFVQLVRPGYGHVNFFRIIKMPLIDGVRINSLKQKIFNFLIKIINQNKIKLKSVPFVYGKDYYINNLSKENIKWYGSDSGGYGFYLHLDLFISPFSFSDILSNDIIDFHLEISDQMKSLLNIELIENIIKEFFEKEKKHIYFQEMKYNNFIEIQGYNSFTPNYKILELKSDKHFLELNEFISLQKKFNKQFKTQDSEWIVSLPEKNKKLKFSDFIKNLK